MVNSTVLVVEPDAAMREMLSAALAYEGYRVIPCGDYERAQELIGRSRPGVMILSHNHRHPSAAHQLVARLKLDERTAGIPIIMTIADARMVADAGELRRLGVEPLLRPFDLDDLYRRMDALRAVTLEHAGVA